MKVPYFYNPVIRECLRIAENMHRLDDLIKSGFNEPFAIRDALEKAVAFGGVTAHILWLESLGYPDILYADLNQALKYDGTERPPLTQDHFELRDMICAIVDKHGCRSAKTGEGSKPIIPGYVDEPELLQFVGLTTSKLSFVIKDAPLAPQTFSIEVLRVPVDLVLI